MVPPAAIVVLGCVITVKTTSPVIVTLGVPVRFKGPVPVFWIVNVLTTALFISGEPKSVPFVILPAEAPSTMSTPSPLKLISGLIPVSPVPDMLKLKGFSSESLVTKERLAIRFPAPLGIKLIVKVAED